MSEGLGFGRRKLVDEVIKRNWGVEDPSKKNFNYNELLFLLQEFLTEEGKPYLEKTSAKRGHHVFRMFVKYLLYRNAANFDSMVLISSEKGTGKSSSAIVLAKEWCKQLGIRFDPKKHIAYTNADMMRLIDELPPFHPIVADEAVRFASSEDWNKKESKELKKKLAQVRTKNLLFILCFPLKITKLEKNFLDSFICYWIDLFARGVGALYVKDKNPTTDTWRLKEFTKLGSYTEFTIPSKVEKTLKRHPNFWNIIKFPKPSEKLYKQYLAVREKNVYDDDNVFQNVTQEDIHKALLVLALRDVMMQDQVTFGMSRLVNHIKNEYDIPISKGVIQAAVEDAKQLVNKIREQALQL